MAATTPLSTKIENMVYPERPTLFCMVATPMNEKEELDEEGIRAHLRRMIEANVGVYVGSGGSGEGSSLRVEELDRLYRIAVSEAKGKVPVYANPREAMTERDMYEVASVAAKAGVDVVQLYQLQAFHANNPNVFEQEAYYRYILDRLDHPLALSIHSASGYLAPVELTIKLCNDYPQIVLVNLHGPTVGYLARLKAEVRPEVRLYMGSNTLLAALPLGAWGAQAAEPNYAPKLCQSIIDHYLAGDTDKAGEAYTLMLRMSEALATPMPYGVLSPSRSVKTGLKALGLPGGPVRKPYMIPPDDVVEGIRQKCKALAGEIPDWNDLPALKK